MVGPVLCVARDMEIDRWIDTDICVGEHMDICIEIPIHSEMYT